MLKRHLYLGFSFLLFFLSCIHTLGQTVEVSLEPWNSLPKLGAPYQEKLYLHFDKPYYASSERMWFRAYLQESLNLAADTTETALYAELINARDSIIYRQKIQRIDGIFAGSFLLNELLPEGMYRVRAYTNYMRNAGESFYYHRPFFIGNNLSSEVRTNIKFNFITPKKGFLEIKFMKKNAALGLKKISYKYNLVGKKSARINGETSTDGYLKLEFNPLKFKDKKPSISVYYQDSVSNYERTFVIPTKNDFDVQLFPEGGEIIHGATNCVAFKAVKTDGLSVDVTGILYDGENQKVSEFASEHLGMGKFCYLTEIYKSYYVIFKTASGDTKRINLPKGKKETFALGAVSKHGRILVNVKSEMNRMVKDSLTLVGHMNGKVFYRDFISGFTPAVVFDTKDLRGGIAHFVLLDKMGAPISERIVFNRPKRMAEVNIDFMRIAVSKRERINCVIDANDSKGNPMVNGSFSVSVTDGNAVKLDSGAENILSNLLLTSDLKGHIEKPGLYFDPNFKEADEALDLLMMTQGWKRFNVQSILKEEKTQNRYSTENGYTLSGKIDGSKTKGLKGVQVIAFAPNISFFQVAESYKEGYFAFNELHFPDKTQFTLVARKKKSIKEELSLNLNEQSLPEVGDVSFPAEAMTPVSDEYMLVANEKYYNENGTRNVYAKNRGLISITAQKIIEEVKNPQITYSTEDYVLEGPALQKYNTESLPALLKKLPGLNGWNEQIQPKTNKEDNPHEEIIVGPLYAIDGNIYSYNEIKNIKIEDLESVRILKSFEAEVNKKALDNNTLIALSFKLKNTVSSSTDKQNITTTMPLGYADNVQFYEPKYQFFNERSNPLADWRSTLNFIPQVKTGPTGKALFSFYASDRVVPYNIVVEGISAEGEPCRTVVTRMLLSKEYLHEVK